jgi:2,3-diketo-5-methylthio-1-phosphopentane phosphatase
LPADSWSIVCDFDGTVTPYDVTDAILREFAPPCWQELEKQWLDGKISARQCMERQVSMIKVPLSRLDAFLDGVALTEGFAKFAHFCRERSLPLLIVSDGLDYAIKRILARRRLQWIAVAANRLLFDKASGGLRLEFPYGREGCPSGVCKCAAAASAGGKTLLIGDGRSDFCLAGSAAFTLAKQGDELQRHCVKQGYPHEVFTDFRTLDSLLEEIPQLSGLTRRADAMAARRRPI